MEGRKINIRQKEDKPDTKQFNYYLPFIEFEQDDQPISIKVDSIVAIRPMKNYDNMVEIFTATESFSVTGTYEVITMAIEEYNIQMSGKK